MPPTDPKAIVRRLFDEAWNGRNVAMLDEIIAPDYVPHPVLMPPLGLPTAFGTGATGGPLAAQEQIAQWLTGFPDGQVAVTHVIAEGELVVTRHLLRGTQRGPFWSIMPTGRPITLEVLGMRRVVEGHIAAAWEIYRPMSLFQQLGLLPGGDEMPPELTLDSAAPPADETGLILPPDVQKAVLRRYFEDTVNGEQIDVVDRLIAPIYIDHYNDYRQEMARERIKEVLADWNIAFPTSHYTIEDLIGEGEYVAARLTWRAVHEGPYQGLPATGNRIQLGQMVLVRLADGLLHERWNIMDDMGLLQQLGVISVTSKDSKPGGGRPRPPSDEGKGGKDLPK